MRRAGGPAPGLSDPGVRRLTPLRPRYVTYAHAVDGRRPPGVTPLYTSPTGRLLDHGMHVACGISLVHGILRRSFRPLSRVAAAAGGDSNARGLEVPVAAARPSAAGGSRHAARGLARCRRAG
jgi:hypothetical protein